MKDRIVEELRKIRQAHAAKFNYNLTAICADLKEKEKQCGHPVVAFPPKQSSSKDGQLIKAKGAKKMGTLIDDVRELAEAVIEEEHLLTEWRHLMERGLVSEEIREELSIAREEIGELSKKISHELVDQTRAERFVDRLKQTYGEDVSNYGFPRTCGIMSIIKRFSGHLSGDRPRACCLISPSSFPARQLAEHIMQQIEKPTLISLDCMATPPRTAVETLSDICQETSSNKLIMYNFQALSWSIQRAAYDQCRSSGVPLIAVILAKEKHDMFEGMGDYDLDLEMGVRDRFDFESISYLDCKMFSDDAIENVLMETIRAEDNWREGLFPFEEFLTRLEG